jgi:hypothetical protein
VGVAALETKSAGDDCVRDAYTGVAALETKSAGDD